MRKVFSLLAIMTLTGLQAQEVQVPQASLAAHLDTLASQSGYQVFYLPQWVDTLTHSGPITYGSPEVALTLLLAGTGLSYYVRDQQVFLTLGVEIVDQLKMLQSFQAEPADTPEIPRGLLFAREYLTSSGSEHPETRIHEIGERAKLVAGGRSAVVGHVTQAGGDPVEGAIVYIDDPFRSTVTDNEGFYSLSMTNGKHDIHFQYAGLKKTHRNVVLFSSGGLDVDMEVDIIALQEVIIASDRDENINSVQMGVSRIDVQATKNVPLVLGERDVLKVATTLAGVQTIGEGASGFNVRGGKSDQNLFQLNGATIYNANHFFGFFSVFNSDAIANMEIYKSAIPARFGGRLSSVFDVEGLQLGKENFSGSGGISPVTTKLTLGVPFAKNKAALTIGGRTTYSNWVLQRVNNANFRENRVSFYDLILRYDHEISKKSKLMVSAYHSFDKFRLSSDTLFSFSDFSFVNSNVALKWSQQLGSRLDGSLSLTYSGYRYDLSNSQSEPNAFRQDFDIGEWTASTDFDFYLDDSHTLRFGTVVKRYQINPGSKVPIGEASLVQELSIDDERGVESAIYLSDEYVLSDKITLYGGIRYSLFASLGPGLVNEYAADAPLNADNQTGVKSFENNEVIASYHGPEWRMSARYAVNSVSSIKIAYNRTRQYIHTLSNAAALSPTDTWRLSGEYVAPQIGDQWSLGYYRNFRQNEIETSVEVYYKDLQNLLDFKVGAEFLLNEAIETVSLQGPGRAYGLELSLKKSGKLNGWINYSFARTLLQLDGVFQEEIVNGGDYYPANYDIPHTLNVVANYELTHRISFSSNFAFNTGRPVTYPTASYTFRGSQFVHYSERNAFRIPNYVRLDLGINLEAGHKLKKLTRSYWSFSIYNLLGRDNPFSVFFDIRDGEVVGSQLIVFGDPIPTLSYNFRF